MQTPAKILIVEDDPDWTKIIRIILEGQGYQVVTASGKEEGLALVKDAEPDLILLDVMMPGGTEGFHFVWEVRSQFEAPYRDIPIILLTAIHETTRLRFYPDQSDGTYQPGEFLPVQDFIDKPVDADTLAATVKRVLAAGPGK
jgi:CheY-like chemotaxis protein